jgi:hypothetical protein
MFSVENQEEKGAGNYPDASSKIEDTLNSIIENQNLQNDISVEIVKIIQKLVSDQRDSLDKIDALGELIKAEREAVSAKVQKVADENISNYVSHLGILKQTSNLILRQTRRPRKKIRCVFLVHSIPMWDALADVYAAMTQDERFDPIVVSLNSTPLGRGKYSGEQQVSEFLYSQKIAHLRFDMVDSYQGLDILKNLLPDVIFRQQQWDTPLPPAFHTHELTFARICVIPYGTNVLSSFSGTVQTEISPLAFDQAYHRAAWKIFCETELTRSFYQSFHHCDPAKLHLSGYPKLSSLEKAKGRGQWPLQEPNGRAFRVIWAPHYSLGGGGPGFGVFNIIYKDMLDWAKQHQDIQFVLKPHPALFNGVLTADDVQFFKKMWLSLPNCAIEEQQYGELFDASDMMVTDGVSFLTEYHLFKKPLVFFDSGHHVPFNTLGKLAEACAHKVSSFKEMKRAVIGYKNGEQWKKAEEVERLLDVLIPQDKNPAASILDTISDSIDEEEMGN